MLSAGQVVLAVLSGGIVGFTLGLLGGGGSILAVPLLLYVVGVHDPHVVIGSTALAVSVNAYVNLMAHARAKHVWWKPAIGFAVPGIVGSYVGSVLGKLIPDKPLLFLFSLLMLVVAGLMMRPKRMNQPSVEFSRTNIRWPRIIVAGLLIGLLSGFFGIGGGFMIVPGMVFSTGMPIIMAIGSSLFSVGTFGLTTAISYAVSGMVNWWVVVTYVGGGVIGGVFGAWAATKLSGKRKILNYIFSGTIMMVAVCMLVMNVRAIHL